MAPTSACLPVTFGLTPCLSLGHFTENDKPELGVSVHIVPQIIIYYGGGGKENVYGDHGLTMHQESTSCACYLLIGAATAESSALGKAAFIPGDSWVSKLTEIFPTFIPLFPEKPS